MEWLNYHHFLYFWLVAKEGSIVAASKQLRLAPPTISGQIRRLEESLGEKLFKQSGRHLVLTDAGRVAFHYADEIFSLGREFLDTMGGRATIDRPLRLAVGVASVLPPSLVRLFLAPAFETKSLQQVRVTCRSDKSVATLVAELAMHRLDVVIADGPAAPGPIRAFNHLLGECGTTFFAHPKLAPFLRRGFPASLHDTPFLLPGPASAVRRALDQWFSAHRIAPTIVAELDDSALAKEFGQKGMGVFAAPTVIDAEVLHAYDVKAIGRADAVRQQFFAISVERKVRHPSVVAIREAARDFIFARKNEKPRRKSR